MSHRSKHGWMTSRNMHKQRNQMLSNQSLQLHTLGLGIAPMVELCC